MSFLLPDITHWTRLEPRPRVNDFVSSLRAEIRDPMWLLTRQRRVHEFQGEDTGSPAYVRYTKRSTPVTKWGYRTGIKLEQPVVEQDLDAHRPLEAQALSEPHTPDLFTRVELGQVFFDLLDIEFTTDTLRKKIKDRFRSATIAPFAQLEVKAAPPFDPRDRATSQFALMVKKGAVDGFKVHEKAKEVAGGGPFPPNLGDDDTERNKIRSAFDNLVKWVTRTYGSMTDEPTDPAGWDVRRLEYDLQVRGGQGGDATLTAVPDREGTLTWTSFDLKAEPTDPLSGGTTKTEIAIPSHVKFKGMPAPRFWDFEEGDLALPEVKPDMLELAKLVLIDYAVVAGIDWFTIPVDFPAGTMARIEGVSVRDVFGKTIDISPAENKAALPGPSRWTIFSQGQPGAGLASFRILPPGAGRTAQAGPVLEEVRFARDEAANLVWAIERITENPLGQPRPGQERDAAVDAAAGAPSAPPATIAPLRYQIESKVPINWIPFLPVKLDPDPNKPAIELEKAAVVRPDSQTPPQPTFVPSTAKLLSPDKIRKATVANDKFYRLPEEEVPRAGLRVQRLVYRARWHDGSTHVWVTRRKLVGAGETQSGLRFDAALPTKT